MYLCLFYNTSLNAVCYCHCDCTTELWGCGSTFKTGWVECWEEWLCGIRVSVATVITLKQKWLISVLSPHWGVIPGSDASLVQRQQIAVHIIAMRRGCCHHCLRPPSHQLGQRAFFLIPDGPQNTQLTMPHMELNLIFLLFSFPLRTEAISNPF